MGFLDMAYGSARELKYQISLARDLGFLSDDDTPALIDLPVRTSKVINGLIRCFRSPKGNEP